MVEQDKKGEILLNRVRVDATSGEFDHLKEKGKEKQLRLNLINLSGVHISGCFNVILQSDKPS